MCAGIYNFNYFVINFQYQPIKLDFSNDYYYYYYSIIISLFVSYLYQNLSFENYLYSLNFVSDVSIDFSMFFVVFRTLKHQVFD